MDQYRVLLNTYREPRDETDFHHEKGHHHHQQQQHILVMTHRQCFLAYVRWGGELVSPGCIKAQLERICEVARNRHAGTVAAVGAVTAGLRAVAGRFWALACGQASAVNRHSFDDVREAVFTLCLDEEDEYGQKNGGSCIGEEGGRRELDGLQILHGQGSRRHGANRWFDSTIQLVVGRNGCNGLCIEHSVAEGIVIITMVESAMETAER
jgi:choline O-acetyltransferase